VSIDDVMAEAGLTRGSFYCYFLSKSDLYAQSVARVVHEDRENPKKAAGLSERSPIRSCTTICPRQIRTRPRTLSR
jgi:AcrR family transcriptional regulator